MWQQSYPMWPGATSSLQECKPPLQFDTSYAATMSPFPLESLPQSYSDGMYPHPMYANGLADVYKPSQLSDPRNMFSNENDWNGNSYYDEVMKAFNGNSAGQFYDCMLPGGILPALPAVDHGSQMGSFQVKQENNMLSASQSSMFPNPYFNPQALSQPVKVEQVVSPLFPPPGEQFRSNVTWNLAQASMYAASANATNRQPSINQAQIPEYGEYWDRAKMLELKRGMLQQNVGVYANLEWELKLGAFSSLAEKYIAIEEMLCEKLRSFIPMTEKVYCTYNPLEYAKEVHDNWVMKFCGSKKKVLFVGMNPGPFGMGQTGVPFGEVAAVRDYMALDGNVSKPAYEHPKRQISGFACKRSEVSGARFWGLFRKLFPDAKDFFEYGYVCNYCPLIFMNEHGKNIIPPSLLKLDRNILFNHCDRALAETIRLLDIDMMVCVGKFVYNRAGDILSKCGFEKVRRMYMMHPSPVQPAASKDWEVVALQQLEEAGVIDLLRGKVGTLPEMPGSVDSHTPLSTITDVSSDHSASIGSCGNAESIDDGYATVGLKSEFESMNAEEEDSTSRCLYAEGTSRSVAPTGFSDVT